MLRRAGCFAVAASLSASARVRSLHVSPAKLSAARPGEDGDKAANSADRDEDRDELARERQLRERFADKIQKQVWQGEGGNSAGAGQSAQRPLYQGRPLQGGNAAASRTLRMLFFLLSIFFLMTLLPYASRHSSLYVMQGLPWWQLPIASASCFLLLRVLYPRDEENRIKADYEAAARANPQLTFDQFVNQRYPTLFQGYRTSQAEAVAAVAACLSAAKDPRFMYSMRRAVGRVKDTKASVDNIVDTLRRDFPQLF